MAVVEVRIVGMVVANADVTVHVAVRLGYIGPGFVVVLVVLVVAVLMSVFRLLMLMVVFVSFAEV